jgi:SAM-dependent methyltransferase
VIDQSERYDRIAEGYARWWAPVLAPAVGRLLDRATPWLADGDVRVLDIGTGTGQLAFGALARWPRVSVVGVDASAGMRAMAETFAERTLGAASVRFRTEVAFADSLPFPDGTFDLALSSFVFQLVPNRARALREARRVIRPGGVLAYVSWLQDDREFIPDRIFDEVLESLGIGGRESDGRSGDLPSVARAAGELRHAGFTDVAAQPDVLDHHFTVEGYLAFLAEFDEEDLFDELDPAVRDRLLATMRERLGALSPKDLTLRFPIVFATGRRSSAEAVQRRRRGSDQPSAPDESAPA